MRFPGRPLAVLALLVLLDAAPALAQGPAAGPWRLAWADEFHGRIGPDWVFAEGFRAGGNNELQCYRRENATVEDDMLVITARREDSGGCRYTSARLSTFGQKAWTYGRMEARIALPGVRGTWPAFWLQGTSVTGVSWPGSGELDVMEQINDAPFVYGTAHWLDRDERHAQSGGRTDADIGAFHVYAIEWTPDSVRWFIDDRPYHALRLADAADRFDAFHGEFFLMLNMAVGGNWPGFAIDDAALPARMLVDYVRVYQRAQPGVPEP